MSIVIVVVGLFLQIILIYFFFPYMVKRAEILATKKDLGEITKKVEDVKTIYAQNLEAIKSELSFSSQQKLAIKEKEREVLLIFLDDCLITLHEKLLHGFTVLSAQDTQLIEEYEKSVYAMFAKIRMDYNKLLIYLPNDNVLIKSAKQVVDESIKVQSRFIHSFNSFVKNGIPALRGLQGSIEPKVGESRPTSTQVGALIDITNQAITKYRNEMNPYFMNFDQKIDDFVALLRGHLGELINPYPSPEDASLTEEFLPPQ